MKIGERTLTELGQLITGDGGKSPYRTKVALISFFESFEADISDIARNTSRWLYAEDCLRRLNGTAEMRLAIERTLHPVEFIDSQHSAEAAVEYFNRFLSYDAFEVKLKGGVHRVVSRSASHVAVTLSLGDTSVLTQDYIDDQIRKCDTKIADQDFDGAITNARTLLEAVLVALEHEFSVNALAYDGDLVKLYKRVQALLGLEPGRKDISDTVKQVLSGLSSIVSGLAGLRNKMSDAHVLSYRPARHHAVLAVNAAKTISSFMFETRNYQLSRGSLASRPSSPQ